MEDRKSIKMEKDVPGGRLQSLKLPRDLSLGLPRPKKQYAPNLNVVRNKDKTKEVIKKNDQKRRERNSNRKRHEKSYLQTAGVFSQGAGDGIRTNSHTERRVTFRDSTSSSVSNMVIPKVNRNSWNINDKVEEAVLEDLMNCDIDSDDEKSAFKPLTLSEARKDTDKVVKKEETDLLGNLAEPFNKECSEENPAFAMVKLPDSFAGKGLSDDPNVKKLFDYPLSQMLEGKIGKLVIRKSGKMEVQIGRAKYELSSENTFDGREDLATIVEGENGEHHIAILGGILNNFVMFPDFESMIDDIS